MFTEHNHLVFAATQLLYVPKHNVGDKHGSYVFEELVWYNQNNGDKPDWVAFNAKLQPAQCERIKMGQGFRSLRNLLRCNGYQLAEVLLARAEDCRFYSRYSGALSW